MTNTKGGNGQASRIEIDGALRKVPGFQAGGYTMEQGPWDVSSGLLNLFGGSSTANNHYLMPVDYTPVGAYLNLNVQPGTGAATINVGTLADSGNDNILANYSIGIADATGWLDLTSNAAFTAAGAALAGAAGDIIVFGTNGNATATGKAIFGVILIPR